ncbi:MAG: mannose-1-phosphate guanylyltransferase [Ignavibacteria bacterium]|nr:mannose-1-phosphate guanylyltransferase [Ignavibacteria bacterium]MBI3766050.1 mannose-1-phosphate guanylyltransferase [Ignavibacteriales bacterium]
MANVYAVIMAGGVGTRFWPRSREKTPKQLLEIVNKGTMIQNTVKRISDLIEPKNVLVVTNKVQKLAVTKQLPHVPAENIIIEPIGRNTAPCIGLAGLFIRRSDPKAVMVVLPADHIVHDEKEFRRILNLAIQVADESGKMITVGIQPTRPETAYGYIQVIDEDKGSNPYFSRGVYKVKTFAEKPNLSTAEQFIKSGDFLWNSGMFIWRVDTIMQEIQRLLPEMHKELMKVEDSIDDEKYDHVVETAYRTIRSISVDYGVMEKAKEVYVLKGNFGWSDVGSWDEVYRISGKDEYGNSLTGKGFLQDTTNTLVYSGDKFVATIGVEDLIVIATENAVLVCKQGRSQEVKEVVDYLRRKQMPDFL